MSFYEQDRQFRGVMELKLVYRAIALSLGFYKHAGLYSFFISTYHWIDKESIMKCPRTTSSWQEF